MKSPIKNFENDWIKAESFEISAEIIFVNKSESIQERWWSATSHSHATCSPEGFPTRSTGARLYQRKKGRVNRNEGALTSSSPLGEVAWTENSSDGKWQEDGRFVSAFTSKPNGLLFAITVEMEVGMKFDGICPKWQRWKGEREKNRLIMLFHHKRVLTTQGAS